VAAFLRSLAVVAAAIGAISAGSSLWRGRGGLLAGLAVVVVWLTGRVVLPRLAHRDFARGDFRRARLLYGVLAHVRLDPTARVAARVSRAACQVGREDWPRALGELRGEGADGLPESVRAAHLNNHAYVLARSGAPAEALALIDEAIALRPDLPGFRHTRGIALVGAGRLDEGIRELDEVWRRGDERAPAVLLEAERCYDLGLAWEKKGDPLYAADYFDRARKSAPGSRWATRAEERLTPGLRGAATLDELV
jgi:tetratricopeptide (TPR) repeat protein